MKSGSFSIVFTFFNVFLNVSYRRVLLRGGGVIGPISTYTRVYTVGVLHFIYAES